MRLNAHTAAERLRDIQYKNNYLDEVPFTNSANHKFRDTNNKIKALKFSSSATPVRIFDYLLRNRLNEVTINLTEKVRKFVANNSENILYFIHNYVVVVAPITVKI